MIDEPHEEERQKARQEFLKLRQAYLDVFGEIGKPTPLGQLILDDLERFTAHRSETLVVSETAGLVDIHATVYRAGKQAVMKRIYARLTWRPDANSE